MLSNKKYGNIKYIISQIVSRSRIYSMEKIVIDLLREDPRLNEVLKEEINLLNKGIPVHRILKLFKLKYKLLSELIELSAEIPNLSKTIRNDLNKIFNALYSINQAYYNIISFFAAFEKKFYIMNISIAVFYSIMPWLIQFINISKKINGLIVSSYIFPNMIVILFYYFITIFITILGMNKFYSYSKILKHVLIVSCIFWLTQLMIFSVLMLIL
jgi:hypothetical protein